MLEKWSKLLPRNQKVVDRIRICHPGNESEKRIDEYYAKKTKLVGLVVMASFLLFLLMTLSAMTNQKIHDENIITREGYLGEDQEIQVMVSDEEEMNEVPLTIEVDHQQYSEDEIETIFKTVEQWLLQEMLLENESLESVDSDLYFPTEYEENKVAISYTSGNYSLVGEDGKVSNEQLETAQIVHMKATLSYEEYSKDISFDLTIWPKELSKEQSFQKSILQAIEAENQSQKETDQLKLPNIVNGETIEYHEKMDNNAFLLLLLGGLACVVLYKGMDQDLEKAYEGRKQKLLYQYPEFVSKLALLTGAGMSVVGAIRRIYETMKGQEDNPLQEEIGIFLRHLDNGMLEEAALNELGNRTGLSQYRKFCSLLSSNMKKGSLSLKDLLEKEAADAFESHQMQIRKMGEEASTKLLIPMIMMLGVVMILVMIPAFMTYQIN